MAPVRNNINFEMLAPNTANGPSGWAMPLKKSNPPKKARKPNTIAICIQIFPLEGYNIVRIPMSEIGAPMNAGIHDVNEVDWVSMDTVNAQMIKKHP
tara:strand:+ start:237 stop:527 length:291 start_codon:yes stop_codon:yes gene_type:complete